MVQPQQRQHPSSLSLFGAVGIIAIQIARCAHAAVMNLIHAARSTLANNFGSEIDFVMRRANARTELHDHICGIRSESLLHLPDCFRGNSERRSFLARVRQPDRRRFRIDNVSGAAIGDMDAEGNASLVRNNGVAIRKFFVGSELSVDDGNFVGVNLRNDHERPIRKPDLVPNSLMLGFKAL